MLGHLITLDGDEYQGPRNVVPLGMDRRQQMQADSDLAQKLKSQFLADAEASEKWRRKARGWFSLRDGEQWDADLKQFLNDHGRPALSFNNINAVINVVCGLQVTNRQEIHVYPRAEGDAEASEIAGEGIKWFDDQCQAETEESRAFRDCVSVGIGCTETRVDYLDDPEGKGFRDRLSPLSMFWDANASKRNLTDARRVWHVKVMELEEALELYPDADPGDLDAEWTGLDVDGFVTTTINRDRDDYRGNAGNKPQLQKPVRIVQGQYWQREFRNFVIFPDGRELEVPEDQLENYLGLDVDIQRVPAKVYYAVIIGARLLQHKKLDPQGGFTFKFMTGQYDEVDKSWYGLIKLMEEPQQWQNKALSAIVHILSSMGKGGFIYESGTFADVERAKQDWSQPNAAIEVEPGSLGGEGGAPTFIEKPVGQLPQGIDTLLIQAQQNIPRAAGVPYELLTAQDVSDQLSGFQEHDRRRAGMTALADYFDALRLYLIQQAELTFSFLEAFFIGRLIRVTVEDRQQYVRFAINGDVYGHDFVIDDQPSSPNQKERDWQFARDLIPLLVNLQVGPEVWAEFLRISPISKRTIEKIIEAFAGGEEPTEEEQQERQILLRQAMAELAKVESEARENLAQAERAIAAAFLDRTKAGDVDYRQGLDTVNQMHEMSVQRQAGPARTKVVDIQ